MAANGRATAGDRHPDGYWGKYRGVTCDEDGCDTPAKCKGKCASHYNKHRWANGVRSPSANATNRRAAHLKHRYGITAEEYDALLAEQDGRCAICRRLPDEVARPKHWAMVFCVDHCHDSDVVRGLLCNDCNLSLGYARTSDVLRAAADYLERWD